MYPNNTRAELPTLPAQKKKPVIYKNENVYVCDA